jgi:hypothetical protein
MNAHARRIKSPLADGTKNYFAVARRSQHRVAVGKGRSQGFFDQRMHACFCRSDCWCGVLRVRRTNANRLHATFGDHFANICESGHVVFFREGIRFFRGSGTDGNESGFRQILERSGVKVAYFPAANQARFNLSHKLFQGLSRTFISPFSPA